MTAAVIDATTANMGESLLRVWLAAAARGWRPYALLGALCAVLYLPGLTTIPPIDRDEARYAQATKQMLESGNYVRIRFQDRPRHKKPIGVYWLQALSVSLLSSPGAHEIWAYRVPSVLGALTAVLLTFAIGRALFDPVTALLGASFLAVSLTMVSEAHQAKTDAVLVACVCAFQLGLTRCLQMGQGRGEGWSWTILLGVAVGLSFLAKGPVGPAVVALTVLGLVWLRRDPALLSRLRPAAVIVLALLTIAPWTIAVSLDPEGAQFFRDAWTEDLMPKLVSGHEGHGKPPGFYVLTGLATFWPGSLWVVPALALAWSNRRQPGFDLCIAWLVPTWLLLELIPTKIFHYTLPLFPPLALLVAARLVSWPQTPPRLRWWAFPWLLATLGIAGALAWVPTSVGLGLTWWAVISAAIILLGSLAVVVVAWRGRPLWAATTSLVVAVAFAVGLGSTYIPNLKPFWVSVDIAQGVSAAVAGGVGGPQTIAQAEPNPEEGVEPGVEAGATATMVGLAGYHEPSVVFLLGTSAPLTHPKEVVRRLASVGAVGIVPSDVGPQLQAHLQTLGFATEAVRTFTGFNYSKGARISLTMFKTVGRLSPD